MTTPCPKPTAPKRSGRPATNVWDDALAAMHLAYSLAPIKAPEMLEELFDSNRHGGGAEHLTRFFKAIAEQAMRE